MQGRIDRDYGGSRWLGWSIESLLVQRPNFARLRLFWQGIADQAATHTVRAELIDRDGQSAQVVESSVPRLTRDEIRRDQIGFWLPPDFPAGQYDLRVTVLDENGQVMDTVIVTFLEVKP
jgi:hypothetical protein